MRIAHAAAEVDLVCGLAQAAAERLWSEPELADDAGLTIEGGRHPWRRHSWKRKDAPSFPTTAGWAMRTGFGC
jgi:DNA mismatch repair ATPase MutS